MIQFNFHSRESISAPQSRLAAEEATPATVSSDEPVLFTVGAYEKARLPAIVLHLKIVNPVVSLRFWAWPSYALCKRVRVECIHGQPPRVDDL